MKFSYMRNCQVFLALLCLKKQALSLSFGLAKKNISGLTGSFKELLVKDLVGKGSYGTVHLCELKDGDCSSQVVAKRSWDENELKKIDAERSESKDILSESKNDEIKNDRYFREKAQRCANYFEVEKHCFQKLQEFRLKREAELLPWQLPEFLGCFSDEEGKEWAVFTIIEKSSLPLKSDFNVPIPAISLSDAIDMQWDDIHAHDPNVPSHRLSVVQREMGLPHDYTFDEVLDCLFRSLLKVTSLIHSVNIIHRDIKPQNLLLDPSTKSLVLIDFGSAADLDPPREKSFSTSLLGALGVTSGGRIGLEIDTVAISPIYSAPEVFVKLTESPKNFDVFSCAMVFTQLLFSLFDQRTDAAFRQQLEESDYNLDAWLARELAATLRPVGFDEAIAYLSDRPGMWSLMKDMLMKNPNRRLTSHQVLDSFEAIVSNREKSTPFNVDIDGSYFASVVEASETCEADLYDQVDISSSDSSKISPRPLNFVATFDRSQPLGLVLAEVDDDVRDDFENDESYQIWKQATDGSKVGEIFVKDVVEQSQAEELGIFEIGDKLTGVGDLPIGSEGFEHAVSMIQSQPDSANTVSLHFSRKSSVTLVSSKSPDDSVINVIDQGAWSVSGRRKSQEDSFLLHEYHESDKGHLLLAGVFDGHGGNAASVTVTRFLPSRLQELLFNEDDLDLSSRKLSSALLNSWNDICDSYRYGCDGEGDACVADYDEIEGIIRAGTGSKDLVAGTTATTIVLPYEDAQELIVLNCGDSRTLLVGQPRSETVNNIFSKPSLVHFVTRDHSPKDDVERTRLNEGKSSGLDYSLPQCSISKWWLQVGDYQYALTRSLEGTFATSKGIISEPDISTICLKGLRAEREAPTLILASDGLFEVIDNEAVAKLVLRCRADGLKAGEVAKVLCSEAVRKGSSDNVSAVIIFLNSHN